MKMKHTGGNLKVWPTHWAGGSDAVKVDGHNTIWLDSNEGEIARLRTDGGRVTEKTYANAARLALAWNLHDELVGVLHAIMSSVDSDNRQEAALCCAYREQARAILARATSAE